MGQEQLDDSNMNAVHCWEPGQVPSLKKWSVKTKILHKEVLLEEPATSAPISATMPGLPDVAGHDSAIEERVGRSEFGQATVILHLADMRQLRICRSTHVK